MKKGEIGIDHDVVSLTLEDKVVRVARDFTIVMDVLEQPAAFALRLGTSKSVVALKNAAKGGKRFELRIDNVLQFVGRTDGPTIVGSASQGSEVTVRGRDNLAPLHDAFLKDATSWTEITYLDLVTEAIKAVAPGASYSIQSDDLANRKAVTGLGQGGGNGGSGTTIDLTFALQTKGVIEDLSNTVVGAFGTKIDLHNPNGTKDPATGTPSGSQRTVQGQIGERWYEGVIKPELDRVGLCLWASGDGTFFVLVQPNTTQSPIYRIENRPGLAVRVISWAHKDETTTRYSECDVHFRSGGDGKESRTRSLGHADDLEMRDELSIPRPMSVKDDKCKSIEQADFLARRKICDSRRANWSLEYVVAGLTVIALDGSRVVWSVNTMVEVQDDILDLHGNFYIVGVEFSSKPETSTKLRLLRPDDMLFGEPSEAIGGSTPKKGKGK